MRALLLADVWEDGLEEPASVGAIESEVPDVLLLLFQFLQPLRIVRYAVR